MHRAQVAIRLHLAPWLNGLKQKRENNMAVKKRLLLVDDDDTLREELVAQFALYDEFETVDVANATDGIKAATSTNFDLILLDVDLPDMLGTEACQLMRSVTKPFRFAVLLARLRAHLRSFEQSEDAVFQIGPYEFAPAFKKLTPPKDENGKQPRDIRLTEKETNILKYLYRAGGKPVGRSPAPEN